MKFEHSNQKRTNFIKGAYKKEGHIFIKIKIKRDRAVEKSTAGRLVGLKTYDLKEAEVCKSNMFEIKCLRQILRGMSEVLGRYVEGRELKNITGRSSRCELLRRFEQVEEWRDSDGYGRLQESWIRG